jgi:hypothetical protein
MWKASLVPPLDCHIVWLEVADGDSVNTRLLSGFSSTCHLYHFFLSLIFFTHKRFAAGASDRASAIYQVADTQKKEHRGNPYTHLNFR